jgi:hypothetical protein
MRGPVPRKFCAAVVGAIIVCCISNLHMQLSCLLQVPKWVAAKCPRGAHILRQHDLVGPDTRVHTPGSAWLAPSIFCVSAQLVLVLGFFVWAEESSELTLRSKQATELRKVLLQLLQGACSWM